MTGIWAEDLIWLSRDLLVNRWRVLRTELHEAPERTSDNPLILDSALITVRNFYRWSMMESPQIWHDASFEEVDALAGLCGEVWDSRNGLADLRSVAAEA